MCVMKHLPCTVAWLNYFNHVVVQYTMLRTIHNYSYIRIRIVVDVVRIHLVCPERRRFYTNWEQPNNVKSFDINPSRQPVISTLNR